MFNYYIFIILFILCSGINKTNYDETLLLTILSKFKLSSLGAFNGIKDNNEGILMKLLQIPSIQETLEHLFINCFYIFDRTSVIELLFELKAIKTLKIAYSEDIENYDNYEKLILEIEQFEEKLKKKHPKTEILIYYKY